MRKKDKRKRRGGIRRKRKGYEGEVNEKERRRWRKKRVGKEQRHMQDEKDL